MPNRVTPQAAIRAHYPNQQSIPGGTDTAFIVSAKNKNQSNHVGKRFMLTYIYLLMIKHLLAVGRLNVEPVKLAPMTLQAKGGKGGNQGAHQVLGELTVGNDPLYHLPGLTKAELRAIVYCNSAVSDIPKAYNFVDNLLEKEGRESYKNLADAIVKAATPMPNTDIWNTLMTIFLDACDQSKNKTENDLPGPQRGSFPEMQTILAAHVTQLLTLNARRDKLTRVGIDKWMSNIEAGGFLATPA